MPCATSKRRHQFPANRSLVPDVPLIVSGIRNGRAPQPCDLIQRPACVGLRRVEHVVRLIVGVTNPGVVAAQGHAAVWLTVRAVVDPATSVVAGLYPRAGRAIDERVEEVWFRDDDLDDFAVADFCKMSQMCLLYAVYEPDDLNVRRVLLPLVVIVTFPVAVIVVEATVCDALTL